MKYRFTLFETDELKMKELKYDLANALDIVCDKFHKDSKSLICKFDMWVINRTSALINRLFGGMKGGGVTTEFRMKWDWIKNDVAELEMITPLDCMVIFLETFALQKGKPAKDKLMKKLKMSSEKEEDMKKKREAYGDKMLKEFRKFEAEEKRILVERI